MQIAAFFSLEHTLAPLPFRLFSAAARIFSPSDGGEATNSLISPVRSISLPSEISLSQNICAAERRERVGTGQAKCEEYARTELYFTAGGGIHMTRRDKEMRKSRSNDDVRLVSFHYMCLRHRSKSQLFFFFSFFFSRSLWVKATF